MAQISQCAAKESIAKMLISAKIAKESINQPKRLETREMSVYF